MAPCAEQDRQRQALALAAAEAVERLLGLVAAEQEPAEQRPRLVGRQPVRLTARLERPCARVPSPSSSESCWLR